MRVTLTLPISDAVPAELGSAPTPAVAPIRAGAPGTGPLVLAVDDHPTNRKLLARQIAALGLRVQTAADGRDALALWQAGGYALVVTDCNMPQMDGYAFSRAIRAIEAKEGRSRIPIIAWTANVLPGAAALCRAAGMDDILTKPAELAVLKETLAKWLPPVATATDGPDSAADAGSGATQIAPIDLAELDKIAVTATERAEILLDFMTHTRSDRAALRAALTMQDLPACARIAHRMKGSSRMVGAQDLAAACEMMERAARQGRPEDAGAAKAAVDRALERLETHLAGETAAIEEQQ
jgi:CheY-like chemotaxis protein/HPt (histidine-containing phosphotransfer) domain-containing protein